MNKLQPSLRKAAILIASLDDRTADRLLDMMGEEQASVVRRAAAELDDIDPAEQREVLAEFRRFNPLPATTVDSGLELDAGLAAKLAQDTYEQPWASTAQAAPATAAPVPSGPFQFLHDAAPAVLAEYLQQEHPQTVAVVVSHLPPAQAAEVLGQLNATLQADVVRRVIDQEEADPTVVQEIEDGLKRRIQDHLRQSKRREAGLNAVRNILLAAGHGQRVILANVAEHDEQLAGKLGVARPEPSISSQLPVEIEPVDPSWTFADVCVLGDAELFAVFQAAGEELAVLALQAAPPELIERICRHLSGRAAKQFRKSLKKLGPLRLSDVERAQAEMAAIAQRRSSHLSATA